MLAHGTHLCQEIAGSVDDRGLSRVTVDTLHVAVQLDDPCDSI